MCFGALDAREKKEGGSVVQNPICSNLNFLSCLHAEGVVVVAGTLFVVVYLSFSGVQVAKGSEGNLLLHT